MPELPEVETIKNQLLKKVKGKTISGVKTRDYRKKVKGNLKNVLAKIIDIQRKAKQIVFTLSNSYSFVIHLKLTGQLIYNAGEIPKFAKIIFTFSDGKKLFFNDFRKFGFLKIMKTSALDEYFAKFGPDPLKLSCSKFKKLLQKKPRAKIKPALLDQHFISGIGNIYAQEACFKAKILPTRVISSLTELEIKKLCQALKTILKAAIRHQGTSFDTTYRTTENQPGGYEPYVKVYHRKNCPKCGSKLKILKQNSRSTYYCSKCQI